MVVEDRDIRSAAITEIGRRSLADSESMPTKRGRKPVQVGYTGLEIFGNIISGDIVEHNREWHGKKRYDIVDRMRRGDATCAATLMAIALPIISTDVVVEARAGADGDSPDPVVKEAADFIHYNLFEGMSTPWNEFLREVFLFLAYGHYAFEKIYKTVDKGEFAGSTGWQQFAPRHPRTFENWYFEEHGGFLGVRQEVVTPSSKWIKVDIPIERLLWFTHQSEAGNPLGNSIFRPAYKHWKYKDGFYAVQAIAVERQGAGVPFMQYPEGAKDSDIDDAEEMLQNIQAHEQSYMIWEEGWEAGFIDMGSNKVLDPQQAIDHHDSMIPQSILAGFLNLTKGTKGSYALSSDSSGFFNYSIQNVANLIAGIINKQAIPELLDKNYPNLPSYPHLRFNKVGHISLDKIIAGISQLGKEGFILPTIEVENYVRGLLNLPPIEQDEFQEVKEEEKEANAPPSVQVKPGKPNEPKTSDPSTR